MAVQINLDGKVAIVTGAARGIGLAISRRLLEAGAQVTMVDIDRAALEHAAASLGSKVLAIAGDLSHPSFPDEIIRQTIERFGSLDILVNNAGYTWDSVIQKTADEQFQAMLDIHAVAPFRMLRAAAPFIREKSKSETAAVIHTVRKIVNITSISGLDGNAGQIAYASGKAAVVGLTKTMAKEWGRYNVTVNAVGFGLIDTRLTRPMTDPETEVTVGGKHLKVGMPGDAREQLTKAIPLGRLGTPEDAANAVLFFCSQLSDYVTGEVLVCGGGFHF